MRGERTGGGATLVAAAVLLLAACTGGGGSGPVVIPPSDGATSGTASASPPPSGSPVAVAVAGEPEELARGLAAPWSILRLPNGGVLVSERDSARIVEVLPDGSLREVVRVPGVVPGGEGGLLGLAFLPAGDGRPDLVYAYLDPRVRNA